MEVSVIPTDTNNMPLIFFGIEQASPFLMILIKPIKNNVQG